MNISIMIPAKNRPTFIVRQLDITLNLVSKALFLLRILAKIMISIKSTSLN